MKTQSKPIPAARAKCSPHRENGPASSGKRLYKSMPTTNHVGRALASRKIAEVSRASIILLAFDLDPLKKTGGPLARAARNQTQGVEARYAIGTAHSSRLKVGLFASTMMTKAVSHTIPWFFGMPYGSHGACLSKDHTTAEIPPYKSVLLRMLNPIIPKFGSSCTRVAPLSLVHFWKRMPQTQTADSVRKPSARCAPGFAHPNG